MSLAMPGGKNRQAKKWAPLILELTPGKRTHYLEPCIGGANMLEHLASHFDRCQAGDINQDLVMMWQAVKEGVEFPTTISKEQHTELKNSKEHSALRAFVGFGCSFAGLFMATYNDGAAKTGRAVAKSREALQKTELRHCSYEAWDDEVTADTVVYADPPYARTMGYPGAGKNPINHEDFWNTMRSWRARGASIFVSEYSAPPDFTCISELDLAKTVSSTKNGARQLDKLWR